jgi:prolyl-tRNA synthetase
MKEAYSFDIDNEHAEISYKKMFDAYTNIFRRCGLEFRTVDADTGSIGGSFSHEFMVLAKNGEDAIVSCNSCTYSANVEKSPVKKFDYNADLTNEKELTPEEVYTPDVKTIEEVSNYLNIPVNRILKTIILTDGENVVAALVRGDFDVNIIKIKNILDWDTIFFATEETVKAVTNAPSGFAGPINIKCPVIADYSAEGLKNFVIGANKKDYHIKNTNFKDIGEVTFHDIRNAESGDPCPQCEKGVLEIFRGIEVGHIFKLGTKYSEAMGAYFLDSNGKRKPCIMGCYGIGIGRTAAAAIEQNFDDKGMILPLPISPFTVHLLPVDYKNEEIGKVTDNIYNLLQNSGIDVLMDDRNERPGIKFNDADLLGFPYRITIGKKTLKQGKVEIYERKSGNVNLTDIDSISDFITMLENQAN